MLNHSHMIVNCSDGSQQPDNFVFGSIDTERLDHESIQCFEINLRDRRVCTRTHRVDETLNGFLGDNDLLD